MEGRWSERRAHSRRLPSGGLVFVRATWVLTFREPTRKNQAYRSPCPRCGAGILSVNMPNGGWAHFEGGAGLGKIKHPCFDARRASVKRGDDGNLDLFENCPAPDKDRPD